MMKIVHFNTQLWQRYIYHEEPKEIQRARQNGKVDILGNLNSPNKTKHNTGTFTYKTKIKHKIKSEHSCVKNAVVSLFKRIRFHFQEYYYSFNTIIGDEILAGKCWNIFTSHIIPVIW